MLPRQTHAVTDPALPGPYSHHLSSSFRKPANSCSVNIRYCSNAVRISLLEGSAIHTAANVSLTSFDNVGRPSFGRFGGGLMNLNRTICTIIRAALISPAKLRVRATSARNRGLFRFSDTATEKP